MGNRESAVESLVAEQNFWSGKKVFLTGHTGFKGSWLSLWLHTLGAEIYGYSKDIPTRPSLFSSLKLDSTIPSTEADIRDHQTLASAIKNFAPEIVVHMAAQSLVRPSYANPLETFSTNIMGTANLLDACREVGSIRAILNVTSDKCYKNHEWVWGYREDDHLGGRDPYSCSKACSELVTQAFQQSYFLETTSNLEGGVAVATARAGNVIGGGDWAEDRLIPDCIRAHIDKTAFTIRYPGAIRPWQYVLDPLNGYLLLIKKLYTDGLTYSGAWNFGPPANNITTVRWIANTIARKLLPGPEPVETDRINPLHEARILKLDSSKAASLLNWQAMVPVEKAIDEIVRWTRAYMSNEDLMDLSIKQIESFTSNETSSACLKPT